jgi:hypothetical protein
MNLRRAWPASVVATLALAVAGCGDPENGGDIVPSTGSDGQTTPATVPNGPGTPETTPSTSSTTTAPGDDEEPLSEDEQEGNTDTDTDTDSDSTP